jgi:hypothetical protein
VADYFFDLGQDDQREGLEYVRARTGRPTRLLEKDEQEVIGECEAFCRARREHETDERDRAQ